MKDNSNNNSVMWKLNSAIFSSETIIQSADVEIEKLKQKREDYSRFKDILLEIQDSIKKANEKENKEDEENE